jgi:hypothetical protein
MKIFMFNFNSKSIYCFNVIIHKFSLHYLLLKINKTIKHCKYYFITQKLTIKITPCNLKKVYQTHTLMISAQVLITRPSESTTD